MKLERTIYILTGALALLLPLSCATWPEGGAALDEEAAIYPDYREVSIPPNIAPLDFSLTEDGECRLLAGGTVVKGRDGLFDFGPRRWKKILSQAGPDGAVKMTVALKRDGKWVSFRPFNIYVKSDPIDPYLSYRLIPPGYQGWQQMGIYQRDLTSYREKAVIDNALTGGNCLNCHSYRMRDPSDMVFHARAAFGGTMLLRDGKTEKLNTRTDSTISALVYPYWHPSGNYIAFSVNKTLQVFHNHDANRIEVYDEASDVVVFDTRTNEISWSPLTRSEARFETFPTFSPDGKWLYFCSAEAVSPMPEEYRNARYGLWRIAFNPEDGSFGDSLECVYDAPSEGFSVSFPRISPDGRFLVFTRHGYGNFSIWHKDADLWCLDLEEGGLSPLDEANSPDVESYHCWSGNGRWLVFSSRRDDGLYTRPWIVWIGPDGKAAKPFMLPQKDPAGYYKRLMYSYNIPELMEGPVSVPRRRIVSALRSDAGVDVKLKN